MILEKFSPVIREAFAAQGMFLKMGLSPDHIFVMPTRRPTSPPEGGTDDLNIVVRREAVFTLHIGECQMSLEDFVLTWSDAAACWNASTLDERAELVNASRVRLNAVLIIAEMIALGFNLKRGKDA